jgi:hypothetical protein
MTNNKITNTLGCPQLMTSMDCLRLCLACTRTIFEITSTLVTIYDRFGRHILIKLLQCNKVVAVKIPSPQKVKEYMAAIKKHRY